MSGFNGYFMSLTEHIGTKKLYFFFFILTFDPLIERIFACDLDANICSSWKLSYSLDFV